MINKQNLWFLTLFSLILVLSVYYVTMPSELLLTNNSNYQTNKVNGDGTVNVLQSDIIVALNVEKEEERNEKIEELKKNITDEKKSVEEKNSFYEELKLLNVLRGKEEEIVLKIKNEFNSDAYVKIEKDQIRIVVANKNGTVSTANEIMRSVQSLFENKMYISVKFEA